MVYPEYVWIKIADIPEEFILDAGWLERKTTRVDLLQNMLWLLWVTTGWYTGQWPPLWTIKKGGLLQSLYNTKPLATQMANGTVLLLC